MTISENELYILNRRDISRNFIWKSFLTTVQYMLFGLSEKLASSPLKDGSRRHFHGFDVTNQLMPAALPPDIAFSIYDILKPFPEEHKANMIPCMPERLLFSKRGRVAP